MSYLNYFRNVKRGDSLINLECTGTAEEFAEKLGICRKSVFNLIDTLKENGAEISYSRSRRTFYYTTKPKLLF
jgi:biotin operon repressor